MIFVFIIYVVLYKLNFWFISSYTLYNHVSTQKIYPLLSKHSITYLSLTNFRLSKYDKSYDFLSTQIKSYSMVKVKCEVGLSTVNEQN